MNTLIKKTASIALMSATMFSSTVLAVDSRKALFQTAGSTRALLDSYKIYCDSSLSDQELLDMARRDWHEIAVEEAASTKALNSLPPEEISVDGVTYRLYGYYHGAGWPFNTMSKAYREFVRSAYNIENEKIANSCSKELCEKDSRSTYIIAEQGLRHGLNRDDNYIIDARDHESSSFILNFDLSDSSQAFIEQKEELAEATTHSPPYTFISNFAYAFFALYYLVSLTAATQHLSEPITDLTDTLGFYREFREEQYNITQDSMNVDIQAGTNNRLPARFQTELFLATVRDENEFDKYDSIPGSKCISRSLYMAGFLKGFAEKGHFTEIPFFMGSEHLFQVKGFLIDLDGYAEQTSAHKRGKEKGSALIEKLLEAQKDGNADKLMNTIAEWNPENMPTLGQRLADCIFAQTSSDYVGFLAGLVAHAGVTYYLLTKICLLTRTCRG